MMNRFSSVSKKWWLFIVTILSLFSFLVVRVADKAHPWERVIVIDSGLEKTGILGSEFCCFSSDQKSLFAAMPNGLIEQWYLETFKKKRSFGAESKQRTI